MHTIFFTNKRVVQETSFKDGAASVSYVTVDLIEELINNIVDPHIFVMGIGEIGADIVRNLSEFGFKNVIIANRTTDKAKALATECGFKYVEFNDYLKYIQRSDVVISSTNTGVII